MRNMLRFFAFLLIVSSSWVNAVSDVAAEPLYPASNLGATALGDAVADQVFGQPDFITDTSNTGGVSAVSLQNGFNAVLDLNGNLYVADFSNNRVLEYDAPLTKDETADRVFGQPDFSSNGVNLGGLSASSLNSPISVAVDRQGSLYVADTFNYRVSEYNTPLAPGGDTKADRVYGQPDFVSAKINNGGISSKSLSGPFGVAVDPRGNLFVADRSNNRMLEYDEPKTIDQSANRVYGQPDFNSNTFNNDGLSASSLLQPNAVAVDAQNNLYVADGSNHRVLEYDWAASTVRLPYIAR